MQIDQLAPPFFARRVNSVLVARIALIILIILSSKLIVSSTNMPPKRAARTSTNAKKRRKCQQEAADPKPTFVSSSPSLSEDEFEPAAQPTLPLQSFELHGRRYYKASEIITSGRPRKKTTSHIWEEGKGYKIIDIESMTEHYYCCECLDRKKDRTYRPLKLNGNSSVLNHWETEHNINRSGKPLLKKGSIDKQLVNQPKKNLSQVVWAPDFMLFKMLLIRWIVFCHIAFAQLENGYFLELLTYLNGKLAKLIPGRHTIRKWVINEFLKQKKSLRKELRCARSSIHLSFDLWTSPNCHAIIAICAHYVDQNGALQTKLIALRRVEGEHSGENQAAIVLKVIKEYGIRKKIGYFMLDNASSNDTCVDCILRKLYPNMTEKQRKSRRLRCLGHVVNLIAQAFLLGTKSDEALEELELAYLRKDYDKIAAFWRRRGALGRLHNVVRYIRMTPQRRSEFRRCGIGGTWALFDNLEVSDFCRAN